MDKSSEEKDEEKEEDDEEQMEEEEEKEEEEQVEEEEEKEEEQQQLIYNNNNNCIQRRYSRFFTIASQRRELSPTRTLKWPRRNRVQITCNTSIAYHMQVSCYVPLGTKGQLSY